MSGSLCKHSLGGEWVKETPIRGAELTQIDCDAALERRSWQVTAPACGSGSPPTLELS